MMCSNRVSAVSTLCICTSVKKDLFVHNIMVNLTKKNIFSKAIHAKDLTLRVHNDPSNFYEDARVRTRLCLIAHFLAKIQVFS